MKTLKQTASVENALLVYTTYIIKLYNALRLKPIYTREVE